MTDFSKIFKYGLRGVSKLICILPTEQKSFVKLLRKSLSITASHMDPKASVSKLAQTTGLSRAQVTAGKTEPTEHARHTDAKILNVLWEKRDKRNNFLSKSVFYEQAKSFLTSSYSPKLCLNRLIKCGVIEDCEDYLIIHSNSLIGFYHKEYFINEVGRTLDNFADAIIHNQNQSKNPRFQRSYRTTKVPESDQEKMQAEIYQYLNNSAMPEIRKIVDKYEKKVPVGTHSECGVSMFNY